jgi:hypothetical protein
MSATADVAQQQIATNSVACSRALSVLTLRITADRKTAYTVCDYVALT